MVPCWSRSSRCDDAFTCPLKVIVAVSFGLMVLAVPPFARTTAVGAFCDGVAKMKTALVWSALGRLCVVRGGVIEAVAGRGGGRPRVGRVGAGGHRGDPVPRRNRGRHSPQQIDTDTALAPVAPLPLRVMRGARGAGAGELGTGDRESRDCEALLDLGRGVEAGVAGLVGVKDAGTGGLEAHHAGVDGAAGARAVDGDGHGRGPRWRWPPGCRWRRQPMRCLVPSR